MRGSKSANRTALTLSRDLEERPAADMPDALLTPRQREVLQLLAEGRSMKEVADILNLTTRTVAFHKYRMMKALRVVNSTDLLRFAIKHGLVAM